MKLKLIAAGLIGATSIALSGCVISVGDHESSKSGDYWQEQQEKNRDLLSKLSLGMSSNQVTTVMGNADFSEAYTKPTQNHAEQSIKVLFYRTQWAEGDGKTTKDECTPIVFRDDVLVGWGDTVYQQI
ncbi:DUF3192 domain-containing protein [Shewanella sp. H8]|uniref:DUF3192 domain-containing protein n=1 Tax=Shewanella sp. H8 TaxID=3342676 RepID=UPI0033147C39